MRQIGFVRCLQCESPAIYFNKVPVTGEIISEALIDQTRGQAPWRLGDPLNCRKCQATLVLMEENIEVEEVHEQ